MPSNKVQPLVQAGLNFVRADDTTNVKPVDCASRKYHEHQQTAYRLSAKQGAALSQVENKHRQKLAQEAPVVLAQLEASAKSKVSIYGHNLTGSAWQTAEQSTAQDVCCPLLDTQTWLSSKMAASLPDLKKLCNQDQP